VALLSGGERPADGAREEFPSPGCVSALVRLSAALASRREEEVDRALSEAMGACSPRAVEEAIVQSYLFLGYPAALNGLARWRSLSGVSPAAGEGEESPEKWRERGERVCRDVYQGQYRGLRENVRALHPDMEDWMVTEGYGKVLGRPGLPLRVRELCIVSILAVQEVPRQLHSHLRGALHVGATPGEVEVALALAEPHLSPSGREEARQIWHRVLERMDRTPPRGRSREEGR